MTELENLQYFFLKAPAVKESLQNACWLANKYSFAEEFFAELITDPVYAIELLMKHIEWSPDPDEEADEETINSLYNTDPFFCPHCGEEDCTGHSCLGCDPCAFEWADGTEADKDLHCYHKKGA